MKTLDLTSVGISLRREHYASVLATERRLDWIEIQPENFMGIGGWVPRLLMQCAERWPIVAHGVALSLGGLEPLRREYLDPLRTLLDELESPWFSEHACYSAVGGEMLHELLPLPFTDEAARHLARRSREVVDRLERPFVVENITYYAVMPGSDRSEGAFLHQVVEEANCGLLLDVNNVYVNAKNHGRDPREVLFELPLHRTRQIHLAGHRSEGDMLLDDHGSAVDEEVWALFAEVIRHVGPVPTLIEWENAVPSFDRLLDEADRARGILAARGMEVAA